MMMGRFVLVTIYFVIFGGALENILNLIRG